MQEINTKIIRLDPDNIERDKLDTAADIIRSGGLVAFPTETVYGLGADALNENAVKRIFEAKGRPSDNPLIVHISSLQEVEKLTTDIPHRAQVLMKAFWPGPLTLVFKKSDIVPYSVTAGLNTVAVRMPSHPVALALIGESGRVIAAPSANRSGRPSPTVARHVIEDLSGRVEAIIDAGSSEVGLESTVLDITTDPPVILRPGGITPDQLLLVLREVSLDPALTGQPEQNVTPRSPGMKYRHYAPKARVMVIEGSIEAMTGKINELAGSLINEGRRVGILATDQTIGFYKNTPVISAGDRKKPETIASSLFRVFREFDEMGVDVILSEAVKSSGIGLAIMNRLSKAAGHNIIRIKDDRG